MIQIQDLTVQFGGVRPIDGLSVESSAPVIGLIGPNGAGKTTLLNAFSGFVTPRHGGIRIRGRALGDVPAHKRAARLGIRRTFQTDQIADDLTLEGNVRAVADHAGLGGRAAVETAVGRAIDYVGLSAARLCMGQELTVEQRHLTEIAKTLIGQPNLVLLDEPGAGLSEQESTHLLKVIQGIPDFCGAQVLLVDHDVALIAASCVETIVLDFGRLLAKGDTAKVLADPAVRRAYLGEMEGGQA